MKVDVGRHVLSTFRRLSSPASRKLQLRAPACFQASPRSLFKIVSLPIRREKLTVRTIKTLPGQTAEPDPDFEHLFQYTSGRWLWDEEQQLRDRYKVFNVAELQSLAAKAIGSDGCISITKLGEGGYNKVFRLVMGDGRAVLARIPNPNAGPPFNTTASEVATMEFVSESHTIKCNIRLADTPERLEISSIFLCLEYWLGVRHLITPLARNISLWKRRLVLSFAWSGMK